MCVCVCMHTNTKVFLTIFEDTSKFAGMNENDEIWKLGFKGLLSHANRLKATGINEINDKCLQSIENDPSNFMPSLKYTLRVFTVFVFVFLCVCVMFFCFAKSQ